MAAQVCPVRTWHPRSLQALEERRLPWAEGIRMLTMLTHWANGGLHSELASLQH